MRLDVKESDSNITVNGIRVGTLLVGDEGWRVEAKEGLDYESVSCCDRLDAVDHFVSEYYEPVSQSEYSISLGTRPEKALSMEKKSGYLRLSRKEEDQLAILEDTLFLLDAGEFPHNLPGRLRGNPSLGAIAAILRRAGYLEEARTMDRAKKEKK